MRARGTTEVLAGIAARLGRLGRARKSRLPALVLVTDPARVPDSVAAAARLPRGSAVIYRAFGDPRALIVAQKLAALARRRRLVLLIGADEALAAKAGAHGLHLPERDLALARRIRMRRPLWWLTGAVHSRSALAKASLLGLDATLLSPVFPSRSLSAADPMGILRFAQLARSTRTPVYALGGVNRRTASRLVGAGAAGLAAVEGLTTDDR